MVLLSAWSRDDSMRHRPCAHAGVCSRCPRSSSSSPPAVIARTPSRSRRRTTSLPRRRRRSAARTSGPSTKLPAPGGVRNFGQRQPRQAGGDGARTLDLRGFSRLRPLLARRHERPGAGLKRSRPRYVHHVVCNEHWMKLCSMRGRRGPGATEQESRGAGSCAFSCASYTLGKRVECMKWIGNKWWLRMRAAGPQCSTACAAGVGL